MSDRSAMAAHAAHQRWAGTTADERREASRAARETWLDRFRREADPGGTLDPIEREEAAARLLKAHMSKLAVRAVAARRRRRLDQIEAANAEAAAALAALCPVDHTWPADLGDVAAECLRCGLPYVEWSA